MYKSEAHLQSLCTKWHREMYPAQWDDLILIYNNPPNAIVAAMLKGMGLSRGVSDQLYFNEVRRKLVWLEYKLDGKFQTGDQIIFEQKVEMYGCEYYVIRNEFEFKTLMIKINSHE